MKNVQMGAKIKREKERRREEASAQARDQMYGTGLSDIRMEEADEKKKNSRSEKEIKERNKRKK